MTRVGKAREGGGMKQLEIENQLRDVVSRIIVQVELATAQGRTDINLALEDAFIPILRSVYNLPHLINLNRKQKNFPGIDLGDDHDRVAFQLTSTSTLDKVKSTVRQFMDRSYFNTFDELYVLILTRKQASYSQASINELLTDQFAFNCKKHIIDLGDLLGFVGGLRLAAQERVLAEFRHILGEVDAFISFSSESVAAPTAITTNLQEVQLPEALYVAELMIDDKSVIARAKSELGYKGKARSRKSIVKMALLLNGVGTDSWVFHDEKLFSFQDMEQSGLLSVVDPGSVERLETTDLADSDEVDNINILKQLLSAETREQLKHRQVRTHPKDGFFFFGPTDLPPKKWTGLSRSAFHLGGADIAQSRVQATGIVEALDIAEQIAPGLGAGGVDPMMDSLGLEGVEEALHRGVVPAVALTAHGRGNP